MSDHGLLFSGRLGRRAFLRNGSLALAAAASLNPTAVEPLLAAGPSGDVLRVGLVTDLHYADKPAAKTRYYRETLDKLAEAGERFRRDEVAFVVELGDFIDAADAVEDERAYLRRIQRDFASICANRYYVLGNHCVETLTKQEFLGEVGQERAHYSFDRGGFHFAVLDACFRKDGEPYGRRNSHWTDANIPGEQLEWLEADLKATSRKVIVFMHQRLDVSNDHAVRNAPDVRRILEDSGKTLAVFQGHSHKNDYREVGGIHYCTLVAMVEGSGAENSGYAVMDLHGDGTIIVRGHRQQKDYHWGSRASRPTRA